jgi:hypothetical protein
MSQHKSWVEGNVFELLPCPFCGGEASVTHIGNDYAKRKKITVKCKNSDCRAEQTNGAIYHSFTWLEGVAAESWNRRP